MKKFSVKRKKTKFKYFKVNRKEKLEEKQI